MAEDPWCCSYDRRGETCPACLRGQGDEPTYPLPTRLYATVAGVQPAGSVHGIWDQSPARKDLDGWAEYIRWDIAPRGDHHEGISEGWKAGAEQERRIWEQAVRKSLGTIPNGLANALVEVRAGVEGE